MVDPGTGEDTAVTSGEFLSTDVDGGKTVKIFGSPEQAAKIRAGFDQILRLFGLSH